MAQTEVEKEFQLGRVPWRAFDTLVVFVLVVALSVLVGVAASWLVSAGLVSQRLAAMLVVAVAPALLGIVALIYVSIRFPGGAAALWGKRGRASDLVTGIGWGVGAFALQIVISALASVLFRIDLTEVQEVFRQLARDPALAPIAAIAVIIIAPVGEEIFFRGMLYQAARKQAGRVGVAVIISALIFALLHVSTAYAFGPGLLGFVVIFIVGSGLALVFQRRGTLLAPIAMHATFNGLGFAALMMGLG